ncbi:MAG: CPBP family intramembrane metalloprotease [Chloroflexi bacterium]|nr:MAG: CPBP family intramembrane metalloprotease [Chloroflexota bacterium]
MKKASLRTLWLTLSLPPVLFLLAIIGASIYFGASGLTDASQIEQRVTASTPVLLVIVQVGLLALLFWALRRDGLTWSQIGWKPAEGQAAWREFILGAIPGIALGFLYIFGLSPLMTAAQRAFGDYVPAGELLPTLGSAALPFFIANVLFAPFVEESIYRGYALTRLLGRFSQPAAIVISCVFFGLLHWSGGFWYILLTGIVAGGLFAGLFTWRKNIIAPFAAHLLLNLLEFLLTTLR